MKGLGFVIGTAVSMIMSGVWFCIGGIAAAAVIAKAQEKKEKSEGV